MSATGQDEQSPQRANRARAALFGAVWVVLMLGWWLLIVDMLTYPEVLVGLGAAAFAALLMVRVFWHSGIWFRPRLRWLGWLRHLPRGILSDTGLLLVVLWRRLVRRERPPGAFRLVRFPMGGDDAESAARRAFATATTAFAPNTYVIGFDRERGAALVHQLARTSPEQARRSVVGAESV